MKKSRLLLSATCLLSFLIISTTSFSQTTKHEIGIQMAGFDDFNILYKKQLKKESTFLRVRGTSFSSRFYNQFNGFNTSKDYKSFSVSIGAVVGWEIRVPISDKFNFYHGPEIGLNTGYSNVLDTNSYSVRFTPRIGYVFGFSYNLGERFSIGIETIPGMSTVMRIDNGTFDDSWNVGLGFDQNIALLSLVYRFETERKKKRSKE